MKASQEELREILDRMREQANEAIKAAQAISHAAGYAPRDPTKEDDDWIPLYEDVQTLLAAAGVVKDCLDNLEVLAG